MRHVPKQWKWLGGGVIAFFLVVSLVVSDAFWDLVSPLVHRDLLYRCAGEYKMDPLFVAAVISAESKFNPVATSKKRAMGLMQLMPETAFELAREMKVDVVNEEDLYRPEVNIRLGFYYLSKLSREFNGHPVYTLAAYNAGLTHARAWAEAYHGEAEEEVIRRIPFAETRQFVASVLSKYRRYKQFQAFRRQVRGWG